MNSNFESTQEDEKEILLDQIGRLIYAYESNYESSVGDIKVQIEFKSNHSIWIYSGDLTWIEYKPQ